MIVATTLALFALPLVVACWPRDDGLSDLRHGLAALGRIGRSPQAVKRRIG